MSPLSEAEYRYDMCSILSEQMICLCEVEHVFENLLSTIVEQDVGIVISHLVTELKKSREMVAAVEGIKTTLLDTLEKLLAKSMLR